MAKCDKWLEKYDYRKGEDLVKRDGDMIILYKKVAAIKASELGQ